MTEDERELDADIDVLGLSERDTEDVKLAEEVPELEYVGLDVATALLVFD